MTNLPVHHFTGLQAIGLRRDGRPIWPILGGSEPPANPPAPPGPPVQPAGPPEGPPTPPAGPPNPTDAPLGEAGMKALQAEREARKALEKQLAALSPLQKLADALGGDGTPTGGKTEVELITERLAKHETDLATEREARWKAEIAHAAGLTPEQAEWLRGGSREEIQASADRLKAAFPGSPAGPRTPAPDPSQGARGGGEVDLEAQIREAQGKGDWRRVISLQNQKLANQKN